MSQSLTESMIQEIKEAEKQQESAEFINNTATIDSMTTTIISGGGGGDAQTLYETTVTEKENLLLGGLSQSPTLNNGESDGQEQGDGFHHPNTNGKSTDAIDIGIKTTELIIQDAINSTQNGHKNGGFDDVL